MICLACFPYQRRWISVLAWVCSVVTLVLTQSKTSWMAGIACFAVIWIVRQRGRVGGFIVNPRNRLLSQLALALFGLLVIACMFLLGSGILESRIDRFLATRVGSDMANLTGRSDIWRIAIDTFLENPWFGYGPNIWDPYFRYVIGLNVFHAHNQLLNVLAASGIIGALGFLWFIWALAARLLSRFDAFGGFTAALATMILLRCISEVPFTFHSFASEALTPMLLLVALAGAPRSPKSRGQRPAVTGEPIPDAK
ncbi:O-antigen ligase family protein [Paucibacter sp. B51]|uniref:O-antigen ligase family protein n=1 Tax=Paucibacter sp. B51 TaxID=2993315 RepID=UPI0022EBE808|nr:O-antigen ligase family protein [Paucibacter sp. B51]